MRKAGVAHSKSSKDMESHVFLKAKTRVRPWGVAPCGDAAGGQDARPWGWGGCSLLGGTLWEDPVSVVQVQEGIGWASRMQAQPPTPDLAVGTPIHGQLP